jgi:predicted esterase
VKKILPALLVIACDPAPSSTEFRVDCPDPSETGTTTEEPPPPPPPPPGGIPTPTAPCPDIVDGSVTFCPDALEGCRSAVVVNSANATGSGPGVMYWHGTGDNPENLLATSYAINQIRTMVVQQGGLLIVPRADPAAVARPNNPFPWWIVCGTSPASCERPDDFILADEIIACAVEQELVDPDRLSIAGFSAGGVMTSHLVDRVDYFAGAVSFSGGMPLPFRPTTPAGDTAVMAIHGGPTDTYCGTGSPPGCYGFQEPSEALAIEVDNAGDFAFVCNHRAGHTPSLSPEAAMFMRDANTAGHPWVTYPFGYPGTGPSWALNNRCYAAGTASP